MSIFMGIIFLFGTLNPILFLKTAAIDEEPIFIWCSQGKGGLSYRTHIQQVLATIYNQARTYNYGAWTSGEVHGAAQCRGDASTDNCLNCILQVNNILHTCDGSFEAVVYYDYCQLAYTYNNRWPGYDQDILYCSAGDTVFGEKEWYNEFMIWLSDWMADKAYDSPIYMGYGSVDMGPGTLYAYAQCYNFLEPGECLKCILNTGASLRYTCAIPYIGGRVVAGSCTFRYESYPFLGQ